LLANHAIGHESGPGSHTLIESGRMFLDKSIQTP
jgi:hypothetical protein